MSLALTLQLSNEKCRLRQQRSKNEKPSKQEKIDMPVLGLAGRHSRRLGKLTAKDRHAGSGLSQSPLTKVGKIDSEIVSK